MSKVSMRDLFSARLVEQADADADPEKYRAPGDAYLRNPLPIAFEASVTTLVCFITLSCSVCIELMPELARFATTFDGKVVVVSSSAEEENKAMEDYFNQVFPIVSLDLVTVKEYYHVRSTPFAHLLEDGYIVNSGVVTNAAELDVFARKL